MSRLGYWPTKSNPMSKCASSAATLLREASLVVSQLYGSEHPPLWYETAAGMTWHVCKDPWWTSCSCKLHTGEKVQKKRESSFGISGKWRFTRQHCSKNQVHSFVPLHPVSLTLQPGPQGPHRWCHLPWRRPCPGPTFAGSGRECRVSHSMTRSCRTHTFLSLGCCEAGSIEHPSARHVLEEHGT